ncbi:MAG: hypothetical protein WCY21_06980 [Candidatus Cloacimonadaceae bacterium]|nr:hypothetical protein [Candidatus Cloacimonadota bacterium]MDX9950155.1 hypothetical protein [Candidatus Syntrophosphaera sp.]NLN85356.1 hypothetical protein [Candidatus Cloacimonadota bacterium]
MPWLIPGYAQIEGREERLEAKQFEAKFSQMSREHLWFVFAGENINNLTLFLGN